MFETILRSLLKSPARPKRRGRSHRSRVLAYESLTDRIALDATAVAEFSDTADRLPELIARPREDVNDDGWLTPFDVLAVINSLNDPPAGSANGVGECPRCDVNQDDLVTPFDALTLINALNESGPRNLAPSLTATRSELTLSRGEIAVNQGEVRDPSSSRVSLTASVGTISQDGGAWEWTMPTDHADIGAQSVTITATDETGNSSRIEFSVAIEAPTLKLSAINDQTVGRNNYLFMRVPLDVEESDQLTFSANVYEAGGTAGAELPVTVEFFTRGASLNQGRYTDFSVKPNGWVGTLTVELTVSDGTANDTVQFALESVQTAPILEPIADRVVQPDDLLTISLPVREQDGDWLKFSAQAYDPMDGFRQPLPIEIETDYDYVWGEWELTLRPKGYVGDIAVDLQVSDGLAIDTTSLTVTSVQVFDPIPDRRILQGELLTFEVSASVSQGDPLVVSGYASQRVGDYGYRGYYPVELNGDRMTIDLEGAAGTFDVFLTATDGTNNFQQEFVVNVKEIGSENTAPFVYTTQHFWKSWQGHTLRLPFRVGDNDWGDEEWISLSARVIPPADGGAVPDVKFEFLEAEQNPATGGREGLLAVTPPAGYGGSFDVELIASDGLSESRLGLDDGFHVTIANQLKYSRQYGNDTYWLDTQGDLYGPRGEIVIERWVREFDVSDDGIYYLSPGTFRLRTGAVPDSEWGDVTNDFLLSHYVKWFKRVGDRLYLLLSPNGVNSNLYRGDVSFSSTGVPSLQLTSISPGGTGGYADEIQDFATDDAGLLYILSRGGDVSHFSNGQWELILGGVESFGVQKDGTIYYLNENAALRSWRNGLDRTVAGNVQQFELDADEILYRLDTDGWFGSIDARSSDPAAGDSGWDILGKNIIFFQRSGDGRLAFFDGDPDDEFSFSYLNGILHASYPDRTSATIFNWGDLNGFIAQAQSEDLSYAEPPPVSGRGIVGGTLPPSYLENQYGQSASKAILGAVGRINTTINGQHFVGSGTLLEWGGNQYVLTAAHVVEDENGNPVDHSQVTVDLPELGQAGARLTVERILGRELFRGLDSANPNAGLDLALLRLSSRIDSRIQGGILSENGAVPTTVLVAGYGTDNSGAAGSFNFGYALLDKVGQRSGGTLKTGHAEAGMHIVNRWDGVEASFASGDSGGPAFIVKRSGSTPRWAPEIVAVHSFGPDPNGNGQLDIFEEKWSVQMTPAVAGRIKQLISAEVGGPQLIADFKVRVIDDGDSGLAGQGEWAMTLIVNGTTIANAQRQDVSEGPFHYPVASTAVTAGSAIQVQFYGYESDANELFTGDNDIIPLLSTTLTAPTERERSILADAELAHSLGTRYGDTEYELLVYFRKAWS